MLQTFPLIAETSSKSLVASFITPNSEFFIRAHQATPAVIDKSKFKVKLFNSLASSKRSSSEEDEDEEEPVLKFTL